MGQGNDTVAIRVAAAMRMAGVTQNSLAEVTGIARPTLQRRLLGRTPFTVAELFLIADALDLEAASFLVQEVAA